MIFCFDSGNTRLKWGLHDGQSWVEQGAFPQDEAAVGLAGLVARLPVPTAVRGANVAGEGVAAAIATALAPWGPPHFVHASPRAGGVLNGYADPGRLGVDRWCALVGARGLASGACLVVGAGTATTVDTLEASGLFRGGLILPGFDLMRAALAGNTAQLPLAGGEWQAWPRHTADAIHSGCLEAQAGAVERAYQRLAREGEVTCLVTGGGAVRLCPLLGIPHRAVNNLVLEGILRLSRED